jgi:hypothetical protein
MIVLLNKNKNTAPNFGVADIKALPQKYKEENTSFDSIFKESESIGSKYYISNNKKILINSLNSFIETFFYDEFISKENEQLLILLNELCPDIDISEKRVRIVQESMIRDLLEGSLPKNRIRLEGELPFSLMKEENVVFIIKSCYLRKSTENIGLSDLKQNKVIKNGFYLDKSNFSIILENNIRLSKFGDLWITNKNIYFYDGNTKGLKSRFSYDNFGYMIPCVNGLIVNCNDNKTTIVFKNNNGWFAYNLVNNLMLIKKENLNKWIEE